MIRKSYRALIFDWDGTLGDTLAHIVHTAQQAACDAGLPIPAGEAVRQAMCLHQNQAIRHLWPDSTPVQQQALALHYHRHYFDPQRPTVLFAEAARWLPRLQQHYWLAVATGKSRAGLERALADTGTAACFVATRTADECRAKPHPEMLLSLCDEMGLRPQEVLMIGDTCQDLQLAANAGADAVAVCTGVHAPAVLKQAPHAAILNGIAELAHWLGCDPYPDTGDTR